MTTTPARARATLSGISSRAWEHPADRGALVALRKLRGFDTVLKALSGFMNERKVRLDFIGGGIRVDERQFAGVHRVLAEVGRVLDVDRLPEVYVVNDPTTNAMTIGLDKPIVVLNSAVFDLLDEDELRFVIAHELGHAVSGHAVYRTLLLWLMNMTGVWNSIPGGALGIRVIIAGLFEWSRKAELSADRAGLLATQDPAVAFRVHMKLASGSGDLRDFDQTSFFAQGQEYLESADLRDSVLKLVLNERASHPYAVVRAAELRRWVDSGDYTAILGGTYPRREDDATATMSAAARQAADSYSEAFKSSQDALGKLVHDVAGFFGSAKLWFDEQLRRTRD
ncbi:MAG TPA: M48 family metallopeptidase [Nocardioides sp.]|uniref:M48 family metallopeptidase n=1 Tax=uncultured Nocardioides sp. TaxID=198441 RepID=UPI000ECEC1E2|nr:M48 family metallopeptidase [uncultured Nocardioides sp.]HCB07277.1 peptidase M48 [Nocardioides sp.]HRD62394.1 M48 family metallopeptidase [Nocardioides sp.]HRI98521.1 M48 family metallopeptidase [Nocardioides sp.]HRK48213.1 M48 family metallopeptidase [Nocardioides sp.]